MPLNGSVGANPAIRDYLAPFVEDYQKRLSQELGSIAVELDARKNAMRSQEMPLATFADSWLAWFSHADMAAVNGGGIRGDRIYAEGPISYLTIQTILPFGNTIVQINMTGEEIKQMLEVSAAALDPEVTDVRDRGFLQMAGINSKSIERRSLAANYEGLKLKKSDKFRQQGIGDLYAEEWHMGAARQAKELRGSAFKLYCRWRRWLLSLC